MFAAQNLCCFRVANFVADGNRFFGQYKMQTADCRLGIKCRLRPKLSHRLIRDIFSIIGSRQFEEINIASLTLGKNSEKIVNENGKQSKLFSVNLPK